MYGKPFRIIIRGGSRISKGGGGGGWMADHIY